MSRLYLLIVVILGSLPLFAQDLNDNECLQCHTDKHKSPRIIDASVLRASIHEDNACIDCHLDIEALPHPKKLAPVDCAECHDEITTQAPQSAHATLKREEAISCTICHGKHDIYKITDIRSYAHRQHINKACLHCHAKAIALPDRTNLKAVKQYKGTVHGREAHIKELLISVTCIDCHGAHQIKARKDKTSPIYAANVPHTCKQCHLDTYDEYEKSMHARLWKKGDSDGPVCTTCHYSHGIKPADSTIFQQEIAKECGGCHYDKEATYSDTFHGKMTSLGNTAVAKCSDCHTAHRNMKKNEPGSSIYPANLPQTCGKCHPHANANFVRYNPHIDPKDKKQSQLVYYVYLAMKWLITIILTFFGVHTILWLQRSLTAIIKGEIQSSNAGSEYIQRFTHTNVILHIIVVISFLGLVATGLPLKYHYTGWAAALTRLVGGIEAARHFHRIFALLTFGYALIHFYQLAHKIIKQGTLNIRPDTALMPGSKDLQDFWANLKWFMYFGQRPQFGRWTYFEKFDYFAILWGIPVMGLSGLVLWFPNFFSRFLPGDVLNIAVIIHSEEALLAATFIFIIHFFHNHLRP